MSQFQFDNSGLARLIPNFRPSDFWFLHRQFNPAFGLFTNLFVDDQPRPPRSLNRVFLNQLPRAFN